MAKGQSVALSPDLEAVLAGDPRGKANGAGADIGIVLATAITPCGDVDVSPFPIASEVWALIPPGARESAFVERLASPPTGRIVRVYHPLAVAEIGEQGLLLRKVVRGRSAREVARSLGVPCFAGPDLAEWRFVD
ncbi:MAG: hypothetical protein H5U40_01870 [Polyangiaceae bacterium]|nr:hypothetical protein [Polyangiaceae bacterium]